MLLAPRAEPATPRVALREERRLPLGAWLHGCGCVMVVIRRPWWLYDGQYMAVAWWLRLWCCGVVVLRGAAVVLWCSRQHNEEMYKKVSTNSVQQSDATSR